MEGTGSPASFSFAIPLDAELLRIELNVQVLLWDQAPPAPVPFGLTAAMAVRIGS